MKAGGWRSGELYNTTVTHSRGEGRSNTPTCQCVSTVQPLYFENATAAKRKLIPCRTLSPASRLAPAPTPQHGAGRGAVIVQHSGGACAVFVFALVNPPMPTLEILGGGCCVLHVPMPNCVRGRVCMPMHVLSVLVSMSVCIMHPHPTLVLCYLCFHQFYQSSPVYY